MHVPAPADDPNVGANGELNGGGMAVLYDEEEGPNGLFEPLLL